MDGDKRKRKLEDEENEEETMEKFFALIKSTREVRERMLTGKEKGSGDNKPPQTAVEPWKPTFTLEDFVEAPPPRPTAAAAEIFASEAGPSTSTGRENSTGREKQESDDGNKGNGLDLNLSL